MLAPLCAQPPWLLQKSEETVGLFPALLPGSGLGRCVQDSPAGLVGAAPAGGTEGRVFILTWTLIQSLKALQRGHVSPPD